MSTPDVTMQTRLPSLATGKGVSATIRLVTTSDGTEAWGTWSGGSVGGARTVQADSSGLVTFVDVVPNSLISPSGTYYEIKTQIGHRIITRSIEVPNVAGPIDIDDDALDVSTTDDLPASIASTDVLPAASGAIPQGMRALIPWQTDRAAARFSAANRARVVLLGDSISVLNDLSAGGYRSWSMRLDIAMSQQNARKLHTSAGWRAASASTAIRGSTSTTGADLETGIGGYAVRLDVGEVVSWTFTGDGYDIVRTLGPSDGSLEYRLDGNLVATVSCVGAASATNISSYSTTYGSHTVTATAITAACTVEGAYFSSGNRLGGCQVWNAAHSGYTCASFTATPALGLSAITSLDPSLVIIALGTNDAVSTFQTNLTALVTAVQARTDASILIIAPYASAADTQANFLTKHTACETVADAMGCGFLSLLTYVGDLSTAGDNGILTADYIHLAMAGEQMIADVVGQTVMGDPNGYTGTQWRPGYRGPRALEGTLRYTASGEGKVTTIDSGPTAGVTLGVTDLSSESLPSASLMSKATAVLLGLGSNGGLALGRGGATPDVLLSSPSAAMVSTAASLTAKSFTATGLTGSTATGRFVGLTTPGGAPTSGLHAVGDWVISLADGVVYVCTVLGTPGTWVAQPALVVLNTQVATTYTLAVADRNKVVAMTDAAASTVTIPLNATVPIDIGATIWVLGTGAGGVTIALTGGVACFGTLVLAQGQVAQLTKVGTDVWMSLTATTAATTTQVGGVELATAAEVITGTDDARVSPLSAWASVSMLRPSAALVESFPRAAITTANASTLITQRMYMVAIGLPKGLDITGIAFLSGTTALSAPTNWWFGIFDSSRVALKFTADQLTAAWGANTLMPVALTAAHTTTYAGLHYLGIMCKGTVPTLAGTSQANSAINGLTPIIAGLAADTGLTVPPSIPFTAGALTASTPRPYCYVY